MKTVQKLGAEYDASRRDYMSWVSVCPGGLWQVRRKWTEERKKGFVTPVLGSVCRVRIHLKGSIDKNEEPTSTSAVPSFSYPRTPETVLQVPLGEWVLLRVGEGQCDVTEACLEGMKVGEVCEFQVMPLKQDSMPKPSGSSIQLEDEDTSKGQCPSDNYGMYTLELHSFTTGKESWEMTSGEKWTWVKSHKERGRERFGKGDIWGASDCYCRAMKLLVTLLERKGRDKDSKRDNKEEQGDTEGCSTAMVNDDKGEHSKVLKEATEQNHVPTEEEYINLKAELHSNLSLCQLRLNQPAKARASSFNATQLDPASTKAWYRLGQASLLVGELQDARRAFEKVLEIQPNSASARQALNQVNTKEKELDNKLGQRLSKMFT